MIFRLLFAALLVSMLLSPAVEAGVLKIISENNLPFNFVKRGVAHPFLERNLPHLPGTESLSNIHP